MAEETSDLLCEVAQILTLGEEHNLTREGEARHLDPETPAPGIVPPVHLVSYVGAVTNLAILVVIVQERLYLHLQDLLLFQIRPLNLANFLTMVQRRNAIMVMDCFLMIC